MIKLIEILKGINEAKQVGNLYHFTSLENIKDIIKSTYLIPNDEGQISTSVRANMTIGDIGKNNTQGKNIVRITLPPLTEERRKETVKKVKVEAEQAKIAIRNIRKDANEHIKRLQKEGLPEDEAKTAEQQVQKTTDTYIKKIDDITATKEAELMQV